jgi:hypothetical protein
MVFQAFPLLHLQPMAKVIYSAYVFFTIGRGLLADCQICPMQTLLWFN